MVYTCDDICPSNLKYWENWDIAKQLNPDLKVIAFVIANYNNKELVTNNEEFIQWYEDRKDWVEIGVHGWDHQLPQEGWRDDQAMYIEKSRDALKEFLPKRYIYRAPGFRVLPKTERILKELGLAGIAHQEFIKYFDTGEIVSPLFNSHCSDRFHNPTTELPSLLPNLFRGNKYYKGTASSLVKIDLGCGKQKPDGYIGVDISENSDADIIFDCERGLPIFDDSFAGEIRCYDFIEHIDNDCVIDLVNEIHRVLKKGGVWDVKVPDASVGQSAFQDPTHKSFWTPNTFKYFENDYYKDLYDITANFRIESLEQEENMVQYWGKLNHVKARLIKI